MKTLSIKGKAFEALYAGIGYMARLKSQIFDERPLSEIAPEIEGAEQIVLAEDGEQIGLFEGYTQLIRIERVDNESVGFILAKPEATNGEV